MSECIPTLPVFYTFMSLATINLAQKWYRGVQLKWLEYQSKFILIS